MGRVPRRFFLVSTLLGLVGCASTGAPTAEERASVAASEKVIVLFRVQGTIENGQPYEPFRSHDFIGLALGRFETGGVPERLAKRFLSAESRKDGWVFLVVPPGTYYLAFLPPQHNDVLTFERSIKDVPRWRVDIPPDARIVYAGTMRISRTSDQLLFGGPSMRTLRTDELNVANDEELARALATKELPGIGEVRVVLMRLQEGPTILHAPLPTR